jgi:hypothetical protein
MRGLIYGYRFIEVAFIPCRSHGSFVAVVRPDSGVVALSVIGFIFDKLMCDAFSFWHCHHCRTAAWQGCEKHAGLGFSNSAVLEEAIERVLEPCSLWFVV